MNPDQRHLTGPLAASSEAIRNRYASQMRAEPCACGGVITAHVNDDDIRTAVSAHQQTKRHKAWWLREAEVRAKVTGTPVPDELLLRGQRCPCGGHA